MYNDFLENCSSYASLGYELYLTILYGRPAIVMNKIYSSSKLETNIKVEQILSDFDKLKDEKYLHEIISFMYNEIQKKEEIKKELNF